MLRYNIILTSRERTGVSYQPQITAIKTFCSAVCCGQLQPKYQSSTLPAVAVRHNVHDDVTKWKRFPRYWRIVWGIHRSPVKSPHKGQIHGALIFALIRLSKKSRRRWFETPSRSLWRHCNAFHAMALTCVSENPSVQWAHWPPSWANHNAPHKHHLEEDINTTTQVNRHWASSMGSKTYRSQGVYCAPWQRLVKM